MTEKVVIAGVGMIPFAKPGRSETYDVMGEKALRAALDDAKVGYRDVEQVYAGYVYGDSTCGQAVAYRAGLTGIPIINVNNNCSTGSSALWLARQAVANGSVKCAVAVGFEQMNPGALGAVFTDRISPLDRFMTRLTEEQQPDTEAPMPAQLFGGAGEAYRDEFGLADETLAQISVKARRHAADNPNAVFRTPVSVEEVMSSARIWGPLTKLMCCPPTCGAAAAVVVSADFARSLQVEKPVTIRAQALTTDTVTTFGGDRQTLVGFDMAAAAAHQVFDSAGVGPEDVDVVELHDCFATNELIAYEALGLTPRGTAEKFVSQGDNTYGGKVVTNPSGGLLSKGHPLGATGLAQCTELVWQLRGQAGTRQVDDARIALQHNLGLGGACVVTMYAPGWATSSR
jgi:sterol carrier protein 2